MQDLPSIRALACNITGMSILHRHLVAAAMLLLAANPLQPSAQSAHEEAAGHSSHPALVNTCVITEDVKRLVAFYEPVLRQKAKWSGDDYAEFATGGGVLAIFSSAAQEKYMPGSAKAAANKSIILEFEVSDVDAEYRRLQHLVQTWVNPPTTQPWGTRSFHFRDPDGNLVDFYSPAPRS